jgi:hypothetical protein
MSKSGQHPSRADVGGQRVADAPKKKAPSKASPRSGQAKQAATTPSSSKA